MSPNWETFLSEVNARLMHSNSTERTPADLTGKPTISAIPHLGILAVSGKDAGSFLQGQTTCDILGQNRHSFGYGAICNPKGRALSNFMLVPVNEGFLLILPTDLIDTIKKKLTMYVLRSEVNIASPGSEYCLLGIANIDHENVPASPGIDLPPNKHQVISTDNLIAIKIDDHRWILIAKPAAAINAWQALVKNWQLTEANDEQWGLCEILAGTPWLSIETSELFVPQMFNLDCLGGISFNKGCYTGQEIIARTHYLGKQKRRMYLASYQSEYRVKPATPIYAQGHEQAIGQVVNSATYRNGEIRLLAVLKIEHSESNNIVLEDALDVPVKIQSLPYTF